MTDFIEKNKEYISLFEDYAKKRFAENYMTVETLFDAMKYSFFAGGKRVRPVLMLAASEMLDVQRERVLPFAFALECIHTYSLIHDDLPAMDNDDYRRGKLTNHKVYGEAMAILAGDALLNFAFSVVANECVKYPDKVTAECFSVIADCAGFEGMIGGQAADILSEMSDIKDDKTLEFIEKNKTAKLIAAPLLIPAIFAGKHVELIKDAGLLLGIQFQIVDDILDETSSLEVLGKSVGKDEKSGKLTYVSLYGLQSAKDKVDELYSDCIEKLKLIDNSEFLCEYCLMLKKRIR